MKFLYWLFTGLVGIFALGLTVFYVSGSPDFEFNPPDALEGIEVLDSDIFQQVYLIQDSGADVVTVLLSFPSGEARNQYAEGMAHYVEHLAWMNVFNDVSGSDGFDHSNAFTTLYSTHYWRKSSSRHLQSSTETLLRVADPIKIAASRAFEERGIIEREYEFREAENPWIPIVRQMHAVLFNQGPLSRSLLGAPEDIAAYSLVDAKRLHQESHNLFEATLVVYGDVSKSRVQDALRNLKRPRNAKQDFATPEYIQTELPPMNSVLSQRSTEVPDDTFIYKQLSNVPDCGTVARCDLLAWLGLWVLDSPMEGGIATPLRFDNFLARSFSMSFDMVGPSHALLAFDAHPDIGASLDDIERVLTDTLLATFEGGVPPRSFERAKQQLIEYLESFDYLEDYNFEQTIALLNRGVDVYSYTDEVRALKAIELQDMNEFLSQFSTNSRVVIRKVHSN